MLNILWKLQTRKNARMIFSIEFTQRIHIQAHTMINKSLGFRKSLFYYIFYPLVHDLCVFSSLTTWSVDQMRNVRTIGFVPLLATRCYIIYYLMCRYGTTVSYVLLSSSQRSSAWVTTLQNHLCIQKYWFSEACSQSLSNAIFFWGEFSYVIATK